MTGQPAARASTGAIPKGSSEGKMKALASEAKTARSDWGRALTKEILLKPLARVFKRLFSGPLPIKTKSRSSFLQALMIRSRRFQLTWREKLR